VSENRGFGKLLASEKLGEGVVTAVLLVYFFDLNSVIRKEKVKAEVFVSTIVGVVRPHDSERKNLSVVVEEWLEVAVRTTTLQHDLDVVLHFGTVRGALLESNHSTGMDKGVLGEGLSSSKGYTVVAVEVACEVIAVDDAEHTGVNINTLSYSKVAPCVQIGRAVRLRNQVAFEENALGDT
jgi:hypothetical protein